jgi:hypoxanthine phosphoribosyltransferase
MGFMDHDIESVLFSADDINARVTELGAEITRDYQGRQPHLVTIVKGSIPFLADLMRNIDLPLTVDLLGVSSYCGTQSSGEARLTKDLDESIEGRHVIVVEAA